MLLVVLFFSSIAVQFSSVYAGNTTIGGRAAFDTNCGRYQFFTDMEEIPFTAMLYRPSTSTVYGFGMVVNKYWLFTTYYQRLAFDDFFEEVFAYQNVYDATKIKDDTRYVGLTFMDTNAAVGRLTQYTLIKVCPVFITSTFVALPPNNNPLTYNVGDLVYVFVYNPPLEYYCMKIAADSECTSVHAEFDPAEHYCIMDADRNVNITPDEIPLGAFVLINGDFKGFIMHTNNNNKAIVQRVEANAQYIKTNSPPIPYFP